MSLLQQNCVGKSVHGVEMHSVVLKCILGVMVSKEGHADSLLKHERTHIDFP